MARHMATATRNDRAVLYAALLRRELKRKGWGARTLAREMSLRGGSKLEAERRRVNKYLRGQHYPEEASREFIAECLGVEAREMSADEDDEESHRQMAILRGLHLLEDLEAALRAAIETEEN